MVEWETFVAMTRILNRKTLGLNGIEIFEDIDSQWKPEPQVAMLQEGLLEFVKVIPTLNSSSFGVRNEVPRDQLDIAYKHDF